jgi:predicted membrane protein
MPLIYILVALILVAVFAWLINTYKPMQNGIGTREGIEPQEGNMKRIANLVLMLVVIGIFLWLINTYIPMAGSIKAILNIVVVAATCVLVLKVAGLWGDIVRLWNNLVGNRLPH